MLNRSSAWPLRMLHRLVAAVACACALQAPAQAFDLQGHRGARGLAPENTLPGFALTLGIGVRQFIVGNFQVGLDYAYQDFARLKNAQKITLGVAF